MANVKVVVDRVAEVLRGIEQLSRTQVMVGIPQEKDSRQDGGLAGNALIGYVHEMGSAAKNIPARPWLVPGVKNAMPQIIRIQQNMGKAALDGKTEVVDRGFDAIGLAAVNAIRTRISSNIPPPLAESTIRNRRRRSKGSSYRRKATTAADVTALVDTGQLRNAVSAVKKKT